MGLLMLFADDCPVWCCEWSGMSNCDVVSLYDVHGIRRCFVFLSLLRGGMIMISSARLLLFGISGSSSRVSGRVSGSFSGVFIQMPLTCVQSILFLVFDPSLYCEARSGSISRASFSCPVKFFTHMPFLFDHFVPAEYTSSSFRIVSSPLSSS